MAKLIIFLPARKRGSWTVFDNRAASKWQLAISRKALSLLTTKETKEHKGTQRGVKLAPIKRLIAEVHANLGCLGMTSAKPFGILVEG
jgi:hypothetical protein